MMTNVQNVKALEQPANLVKSFQTLYHEEKFLDVNLIVEGKCMKAHKLILSSASDFFRIILKDCKLDQPILTMESFKFSEMEAVLEFMYTGKLRVSADELLSFMKIADLLKIKGVWEDSERNSGSARLRRQILGISLESGDQMDSNQRVDFSFRAPIFDVPRLPTAREASRLRQPSGNPPSEHQDEPTDNTILNSASKGDSADQSDEDKSIDAVSRQQNEQHQSTNLLGENGKSGHVVFIEHCLVDHDVDVINVSHNESAWLYQSSRRDELCPPILQEGIPGPEVHDHSFQERSSNQQGIGESSNLVPCTPKTGEKGASPASCSFISLEDSNLNGGSESQDGGMDRSVVDSRSIISEVKSEKNLGEGDVRPEEHGTLDNEVPSRISTPGNGQESSEISNAREENEITTLNYHQQTQNLEPEKLNRFRRSKRKVQKTSMEQDNAEVPHSLNVGHKRRKLVQTEEPNAQLQNPSLSTENRATYECKKCQKSFLSSTNLRHHLRLSCDNPRLFGCPYCEHRSNQKNNLLVHVRRRHPAKEVRCIVRNPKTIQNECQDGYSQQCQYCGQRFKYEVSRARHSCPQSKLARNPGHLIDETHKCEKCQTTYFSKYMLQYHLKFVCNNPRLFGCPYCEYRANYRNCLVRHVKKIHPNQKVTCIDHKVRQTVS